MTTENEANEANVAELQAHIDLASARAQAVGPTRGADSLTDLTDYYERLVQIRRMTIDTLTETAKEAEANHKQVVRRWMVFASLAMVSTCSVILIFAPDVVQSIHGVVNPYLTIDRIVTHLFVAVAALGAGHRSFA
jgi:hypothetical protein